MARVPQQLQIATGLDREAHVSQGLQQPPNDGMSEAGAAVAKEFSKLAHYTGELADHAAKVEGDREGHLAGMDPEFRTRVDGTIRGEAFDRAGLETAKARIATGIQNDIETAQMKFRANPQGLAKELQGRQAGWEGNVPTELVPQVRNMITRGSTAAFRQATRELWADQAEQQKGAMQEELARVLRTTQQAAYLGGLDEQAVQLNAENVAQLSGVLGRKGMDGKYLVHPAAAQKLIADAKEVVARATLEGAFDRLSTPEEKAQFIRKMDEDFAKSRGVSAAFDYQTFASVKGHLEAGLRKSLAASAEANGILANLVKKVDRRATTGEAVQEAEIAALQSRVVQSKNADLQEKLDDGIDALRFMQQFKTLPVGAMEQAVDQMRQEIAGSPPSLLDTAKRLKAAEEMLTKAQGEIKRNPLAWEGRVGMTQVVPLGTVDLNAAGALEQWGAQRIAQADNAAARHGLPAVPYLEPTEQRMLAKAFEQGGQQGLAAVTYVRRAFGDKAETVLGQIGKEAPAGALLGQLALSTGTTAAVLDGAEGLAAKTQAGHKSVAPSSEKAKIAADEVVGTALGNARGYMTQAMRLADAIYETRAYRAGKIEAFDDKLWKQALREALGEHEVNGVKYGGLVDVSAGWSRREVVLPPSVSQRKAASVFLALAPDDLGAAEGGGPKYGNGRTLTRQELRNATYVTKEPGKYWLLLKGDGGPTSEWAGDGAGGHYVLDLEQAMRAPSFRYRRPDLVR